MVGKTIKYSSKEIQLVQVQTKKQHKLYKKVINESGSYLVHVSDNVKLPEIGQTITITNVKPISKTKKWIYIPENIGDKS